MTKIIIRVAAIALALAILLFMTVALTSGMFISKSYLEPWNRNYYKKYDDVRMQVVAHGLLAPNGHNIQPWKIKLDEKDASAFYLYGDSQRLTPDVDPPARQFTITQGTFLEYCAVAAEKLGYTADISLFPDGVYDADGSAGSIETKPAAKVTLRKSNQTASDLYNALFLPDTSRVAYSETKLSDAQLEKLTAQNSYGNILFRIYQDKADMDKISRYVTDSAVIEGNVHAINADSVKLTRYNEYLKNRYRSGFSIEGSGVSGFPLYLKEAMVTMLPFLNSEAASKDAIVSQAEMAVNHTPAYAMIITKDNGRTAQVQAGMLYSRVQLKAEAAGLAVQPLSQSLEEYPQMSDCYQGIHKDYAPDGGTIQMLFRIGKPVENVPVSMRRDASDLLMK